MTAARRTFILVLFGTLLLEALWSVVLPPFRGIDEFDHAYRAAAVARGEWHPEYVATPHGRGDLVTVPRDIVTAAHSVCDSLPYTGPGDCNPVEDAGNGMVTVGSGAARYNPVFYWVTGTAARPFSGTLALYVMRAMAGLLCAIFFAAAATILLRISRSWWSVSGLLVATTPMATYTFAVAAPNGVELASAFLLWVALLGLAEPRSPRAERFLLASSALAASTLTTVKTLGPVWLALTVAAWLLLVGWRRAAQLISTNPRTAAGSVLWTIGATGAAVAWSLASGTNSTGSDPSVGAVGSVLSGITTGIPFWILQSIGVFPSLNQQAFPSLYAVWLLMIASLFVFGVRSIRSGWAGIWFVFCASLAIPVAVTVLTYDDYGLAWQGRYGMPLGIGFFLVLGKLIPSKGASDLAFGRQACLIYLLLSCTGTVVAMLSSIAAVGREAPVPGWSAPPPELVILGCLIVYSCFLQAGRFWLPRHSVR
jgi:hypothetical protein